MYWLSPTVDGSRDHSVDFKADRNNWMTSDHEANQDASGKNCPIAKYGESKQTLSISI